MRSILTLSVAVVVVAATGRAEAGYCGEPGVTDQIREVERYGKRGGKPPELDELCLEEAAIDRRLVARFVKACDAILARDSG